MDREPRPPLVCAWCTRLINPEYEVFHIMVKGTQRHCCSEHCYNWMKNTTTPERKK